MPAQISEEGKKDIAIWLEVVHAIFDRWQAFGPKLTEVYLSESRLLVAVTSKWHDCKRMKDFHEIKIPERFKYAAFLTYWLVKVQPLQAVCVREPDKRWHVKLIANADFALHCAFAIIRLNESKLDSKIYRNLLYTLVYRYVSPEHLALTYQALFEQPPQ